MTAEKIIPNIYFLYGQQNSGKTLTAQFLGKKYKTGYFVAKPTKEGPYEWTGYTDQKVIVLENDMYKARYFEDELLIMYPYYNRIRNVNLKPEVLLILSRDPPDTEMRRIIQTYKGSINMLQPKVFTDTFDVVLNRVSNLYNLKDVVAEFKKERKEIEERRLQEEKRRKQEEEEARRKAEMKKPVIKIIDPIEKKQPEQNLRGMKVIIQVSIKAYTKLVETIKENQFLRFFVSSSDSENAYIFAVFRKTVEHANICGEIYHKVYSSYWENIEWIWKKGTFLENYRFGGYDDLKNYRTSAREILSMPDSDAMDALTLEEYSLYRTLKKINN